MYNILIEVEVIENSDWRNWNDAQEEYNSELIAELELDFSDKEGQQVQSVRTFSGLSRLTLTDTEDRKMENANNIAAPTTDTDNVIESNTEGTAFVPLDERLAALGETLGTIKAYPNDMELADIDGTRSIKFLYQVNSKTGKKRAENSVVRIPTEHLTTEVMRESFDTLAPYFLTFLQSHEDAYLKADHAKGLTAVYVPSLGLGKIIARMESLEIGRAHV